jgi:putative transposase
MSNLRRYDSCGKPYFITSVTHNRLPILSGNETTLLQSINDSQPRYSCTSIAWIILPDHFHLIIDINESDISQIMHYIKQSFSIKYRNQIDMSAGRFWQYRFWDHIIRNQKDFNRHVDYIHFNPIKHGLTKRPFEYQFSSIHQFGDLYQSDWGNSEPDDLKGIGQE